MPIPTAKDKPLFTPGPLTTSRSVKQAMLRDLGSRDQEFINLVRRVRQSLLNLAGVSRDDGYEAILMQGSGTFGIESVIGSTVPRDGKMLVVINGAYGERMAKICQVVGIETAILKYAENKRPSADDVENALTDDGAVTHCILTSISTNSMTSSTTEDP